jgi:hypothetical protein
MALIGARVRRIREKGAPSRAPSKLCSQRPGNRKVPGLFLCLFTRPARWRRPGDRWIATTGIGGCSLTSCRKTTSVLADGSSCNSGLRLRAQSHFGCVHALRGHATWCWWSGMCAVLGQTTCSETPHPTGCSRLGTAEVEVQEALVELTLRGRKPAATIGRRRNPSPDGKSASLTQRPAFALAGAKALASHATARRGCLMRRLAVPAFLAGSRGFVARSSRVRGAIQIPDSAVGRAPGC